MRDWKHIKVKVTANIHINLLKVISHIHILLTSVLKASSYTIYVESAGVPSAASQAVSIIREASNDLNSGYENDLEELLYSCSGLQYQRWGLYGHNYVM